MDFADLETWVNINSGSGNLEGLSRMADLLEARFLDLDGQLERIQLEPVREWDGTVQAVGDALRFRFRPGAPLRVLFSGHMDTVFAAESAFQRLEREADGRFRGPGVADMKGGLFILLEAVREFLETDRSGLVGGEVLITGDEEIGSPGSRHLIHEAAEWNHVGLVFESALPGGELVCQRMGTGTYRLVTRGRSAHVGRDFQNGRNAVAAMADLAGRLHRLNGQVPGAIFNIGSLRGGGAVNVVPDKAEAWLNVRLAERDHVGELEAALQECLSVCQAEWEGIHFSCEGGINRPPKEESPQDARLHDLWNKAEASLDLPPSGKRETGGSSDGNLLGEAGLPHLDGVGIRGGNLHSEAEFALPESIPGQVQRTVAFLKLLPAEAETLQLFSRKVSG